MTATQQTLDTTEVLNAIERWIKQRSKLDPRDYWTSDHWNARSEGQKAYRQEARSIAKDRVRAMAALKEARSMEPRPELLANAFRAFSGRLEWKEYPACDIKGDKGTEAKGYLNYTTGQYWPTEYRKAAASVLEAYVSACKQAIASANPVTFTYQSMDDVRAANAQIGAHWFDKSSMRFFKTKIESQLIPCGWIPADGDKPARASKGRFITSECGPDEKRKYTIREAQPDGSIDTIGSFQGFDSLASAKANVLCNG